MPERKLILKNNQAAGDAVMLSAAIRDLHLSYPGQFLTDVRTDHSLLFRYNPNITPLLEQDPDVRVLQVGYTQLLNTCRGSWDDCSYHFSHGFRKHLEQLLEMPIRQTKMRGEVYFGPGELKLSHPVLKSWYTGQVYWLINAGWKDDFTCKAWPHERYVDVVNRCSWIQFVQIGRDGEHHQKIHAPNCVSLLGQTDLRDLCVLTHFAEGVLTPVSLPMHLAAAVPVPAGRSPRSCIVLAGGRENPVWEQYPGHVFLHTVGRFDCCKDGPCMIPRVHPQPLKVDPKTKKKIPDVANELVCKRASCWGSDRTWYPACMLCLDSSEVARLLEYEHTRQIRFS